MVKTRHVHSVLPATFLLVACGSVSPDESVDAASDASDANQASPDAEVTDAPAVARSCRDVPAGMPSGAYTVRPDGSTPVQVSCDMSTEGGGWTLIFVAGSDNYDTTSLGYSIEAAALGALFSELESLGAPEVLLALRDTQQAALSVVAADGTARFPLPTAWRQGSPFEVVAGQVTLMARVNGAQPTPTTLYYGSQGWGATGTNCGNATWNGSGNEGRICLDVAAAPAYTEFAIPRTDACSHTATLVPTGTLCSASKRYSIAVR